MLTQTVAIPKKRSLYSSSSVGSQRVDEHHVKSLTLFHLGKNISVKK